jgi:hypothetical protein
VGDGKLTFASAMEMCPLLPPTSTTVPSPSVSHGKALRMSEISEPTATFTVSIAPCDATRGQRTLCPAVHSLRETFPFVRLLPKELVHRHPVCYGERAVRGIRGVRRFSDEGRSLRYCGELVIHSVVMSAL